MTFDRALIPSRPWREIARELARETNRDRITELSEELNRALAEQLSASAPIQSQETP